MGDAPAADAYGAPADEYGAPADDAYGAPAEGSADYDYEEASGAPADDAYGAPAEGSALGDDYYDDYAEVPLDAYAATEAPAPTYEEARRGRTRGGFGSSRRTPAAKKGRAGRARTFGKRPTPSRKAPRRGQQANRPAPAPRRQQEQRRGRGLIPIPIPHRGPQRNAIAFRHNARQG